MNGHTIFADTTHLSSSLFLNIFPVLRLMLVDVCLLLGSYSRMRLSFYTLAGVLRFAVDDSFASNGMDWLTRIN